MLHIRTLLGSLLSLAITLCPTVVNAQPDLHELTLQQTQTLLSQQKITVVQLASYYQQRIAAVDSAGPNLNAVALLNPLLKQQAEALDAKLQSGVKRGKLFGALVVLKDNIDAKGMANTAGSWLMREHMPASDAFLVKRLLAEDALILGKTNLSEWANFRSTMSSSGWSSLHGQTLNPHDITRSPCGSSAGSGVAIAADLALLAVGTETDGSVTCPAAVNGIVGIKPTLGLISRSGIIPIAHSQDTAGPMARTLTDAVIMLEAMMGKDNEDAQSRPGAELSSHLQLGGLKGKRIGIVRNLMGYHPQLDDVFDAQLALLTKAGAILVDNANISTQGQWDEDEYTVLLSEFKADLNHYLQASQAPLKDLNDAIAKNQQFARHTMPIFGQEIFIRAQKAADLTDPAYLNALKNSKQNAGKLGIDATLAQYNVDLLIAPTTAPAWKIDHIDGDHYLGSASGPAAVSGYPHITVPMGKVQHLPVNISFFAGALSEGILIEAAYDYEQLSQARVSPKLAQ